VGSPVVVGEQRSESVGECGDIFGRHCHAQTLFGHESAE
jgi:hypothetical protein